MSNNTLADPIFKEACSLTQAAWAAHVAYDSDSGWVLRAVHRLTKPREQTLRDFLVNKETCAWLGGALSSGRVRSCAFEHAEKSQRLCAFPLPEAQSLCLVGSDAPLDATAQRIWKLAALALACTSQDHHAKEQTRQLQQAVLELEETQQELQARIAAQREAEARLVQAAKLAAVGEMAAGVAHELNNPLTSVVGFTELSLDALAPDSPLYSDLDLVLREAKRARAVVRRLLDFARQGEMLRVQADLNEVVNDVVMLTRHLLHTSGIQLTLTLDEGLPTTLLDRNQMKQVLLNLVNNAIYAMPHGGVLRIGTEMRERYGRNWLCLSVSDNGLGIPPENLERIFEPFFTTRGEKGGTGLGLSVTYGIVTEHGGMIGVESEVNAGTNFTVWLPQVLEGALQP